LFVVAIFISSLLFSQENKVHEFKIIHDVEATPVKSQGSSGTCWCFATQSFLESELIRMEKGTHDLSEMYVVRNIYPLKADKYMRFHGKYNFGPGGQAHDVMITIKKYGIVPQKVFPGKLANPDKHDHAELDLALKGFLNGVTKNNRKKISDLWQNAFNAILDVYLGENPEEFEYNGKTYTPKSFREYLGINPDDYVEFTSYSNYPFYEKVILEVPDNWSMDEYYNIPLDDFVRIAKNVLQIGYSIAWDGDTGKEHFYKEGYAVYPVEERKEDEKVTEPEEEIIVTQEIRQKGFDSYEVNDDHLMHITGLAENQNGTEFFYTKNSWGTEEKGYDGYWYMSEKYFKMKTIAFMVHKDAVPKDLREKLGF
jgi:bleomycin hydrolase